MKRNDIQERIRLITDPAYQEPYYGPQSMQHAVVAPNDLISQTLVSKLASLVEYCEMERRGLLSMSGKDIRDMLLDDPEVATWVHQHRNDKLYSMRMPR
jgi:hypothetical protein